MTCVRNCTRLSNSPNVEINIIGKIKNYPGDMCSMATGILMSRTFDPTFLILNSRLIVKVGVARIIPGVQDSKFESFLILNIFGTKVFLKERACS